jgi:CRP-like cAMP-binding protein
MRRTGNHLLDTLPETEYRRVEPELQSLPLIPREVHWQAGGTPDRAIFPITGVVSLVTPLNDGSAIEIATVGNEGVVGVEILLGPESAAGSRAISQVSGEALSMSGSALLSISEMGGSLRPLLFGYTKALMAHIAQSVACNAAHPIHERCARWLLQTHDRVSGDQFGLTQEFLANMLGVRRASVTTAALTLQEAGMIRYQRGRITILDRAELEATSCECYERIRSAYRQMMPLEYH